MNGVKQRTSEWEPRFKFFKFKRAGLAPMTSEPRSSNGIQESANVNDIRLRCRKKWSTHYGGREDGRVRGHPDVKGE